MELRNLSRSALMVEARRAWLAGDSATTEAAHSLMVERGYYFPGKG